MPGMRYGSMPRRYSSPMTASRSAACACTGVPPTAANGETACDGMVLAMAYVLSQPLTSVYEPERGFERGTLFPELDKPLATGGTCRG